MSDFRIYTLSDSTGWQDAIASLDEVQKDIYFTPQYHKLFETLGDGKACCFVFSNGKDVYIRPYLLNSIAPLSFGLDQEYFDIQSVYGYSGPIATCQNELFISKAQTVFEHYCQSKNIIAEFTRFHPLLSNYQMDTSANVVFDRETVVVKLTGGYSDIWKTEYNVNARNMIRKAQKLAYRCDFVTSPSREQIAMFAELYAMNMAKVSASKYYFFNDEFFHNTFSFLRQNVMLVNILDNKDVTVATTLLLRHKPYLHYHLSARIPTIDNSVNSFLIDSIIQYGSENGYESLHLGGGRSGAKDDSLLKFKKNFSKSTLKFYIGKKVNNPVAYTSVVNLWEQKYPEKKSLNKNVLLKYRM